MKKTHRLRIGVDIGGTKVHVASLFDFKVREVRRFDSCDREVSILKQKNHLINSIIEAAQELSGGAVIEYFGVASAGPLDLASGAMISPSNFPGWGKFNLLAKLRERAKKSKLKVLNWGLQNDAMGAAIGEAYAGGARGLQTFAMITLGTGVGTGVIFNGSPLQSAGMGSEWGIGVVGLGFEQTSTQLKKPIYSQTAEGLISGTGLALRAQTFKLKSTSGAPIENSQELASLARAGDPQALKLFDEMARALAALCANLSLGLNLEMILLAGSLLKIEDLFLPQAKAYYAEALEQLGSKFKCPIRKSKLGDHAPLIGAAYLDGQLSIKS